MAKTEPYVENKDFTPEPTDIRAQFNTSGLGASDRIEETAAVYEQDKVGVAQQITAALDPKDTSVGADKVLLPDTSVTNEAATKDLQDRAKAVLKEEETRVAQHPSPAQQEAAEKGDSGSTAAAKQEQSNATVGTKVGQHSTAEQRSTTQTHK